MKKLKFWFKKEFGVLSTLECIELNLQFSHNIFGDSINHLNCRSIWRDKKGKSYRCESLFITDFDGIQEELKRKYGNLKEKKLNSYGKN